MGMLRVSWRGSFAPCGWDHGSETVQANSYPSLSASAEMLFPAGNYIFQQDNDPKHTAKTVQEYIGTKNWNVLDWPSHRRI